MSQIANKFIAGPIPANKGGTGIANNVASTVTISGAFATTLTLTAPTSVTLPTTGILSTLAGTETLTNKTLTAPIIATIVNTGTLTLPNSTDTLIGRVTTDTLSNKTFSDAITGTEISTPSNPTSGKNKLYFKSDGLLYSLNSSGGEFVIGNTILATAIIRDEKASGTNGGTFTSGAWQTRDLNTLINPQALVTSLSSNQFTLPAGTYFISARAPALSVNAHKIKLRNITDSSDTIIGSSEREDNATSGYGESFLDGIFTISSSKTFEIQHQGQTTVTNTGFGFPSSLGVNEVYTEVTLQSVVPSSAQIGISGSDWKNDLTFAPNGFGTVTNNTIWYRRVGDSMQVRGSFTAGTTNATTASISMPGGYAIDSAKLSTAGSELQGLLIGLTSASTNITAGNDIGYAFYDGSDTSKVYYAFRTSSNAFTKDPGQNLVNNNIPVVIEFEVPISGWSSNNGTNAPTPSMRYYSSGTSISGSLATIIYATQDYDNNNAYSSGVYTIPQAGKYQVNAALLISGTITINQTYVMEIQKNGTVVSRSTINAAGAITQFRNQINDIINCALNDTLQIQVSSSSALPAIVSSNFDNFISISKLN